MTSSAPDRVTVRSVARAAGVSVATVSRVLSRSPKVVSPETRERVEEAARRLGYSTNLTARALATGLHRSVAVLVPDLGNQHFTLIARSVVLAAAEEGWHTVIAETSDRAEVEAELAVDLLRRSDALVMCSPRSDAEALAAVLGGSKPVVTVNRHFSEVAHVASVETDALEATRALVQELLALGHRRVAFLGARTASEQNRLRWALIDELVTAAGGKAVDVPMDEPLGDHDVDLVPSVRRVLAAGHRAIVAANDVTAAQVIDVLRQLGLSVPADVSVVGFDDTPLARWLHPQLTTASMHENRLGQAAWRAAQRLLADPADVEHLVLRSTPVVRASIGPAPTVEDPVAPAEEPGGRTTREPAR